MVIPTDTIQTNINKLFGNKHKVLVSEGYSNRSNSVLVTYPLAFATKNDEVNTIVTKDLWTSGYTITRLKTNYNQDMMELHYFIACDSTITPKPKTISDSTFLRARPLETSPLDLTNDDGSNVTLYGNDDSNITPKKKVKVDESRTTIGVVWNILGWVWCWIWFFLGLLNQLGFYIKVILFVVAILTFFNGRSSPREIYSDSLGTNVSNTTSLWDVHGTVRRIVVWLGMGVTTPKEKESNPIQSDELEKLKERANHIEKRLHESSEELGSKDKLDL